MVGFRNIAVHEYQEINFDIRRAIAKTEWRTIVSFLTEIGINVHT